MTASPVCGGDIAMLSQRKFHIWKRSTMGYTGQDIVPN